MKQVIGQTLDVSHMKQIKWRLPPNSALSCALLHLTIKFNTPLRVLRVTSATNSRKGNFLTDDACNNRTQLLFHQSDSGEKDHPRQKGDTLSHYGQSFGPIKELCGRIRSVNKMRQHRILLHTDAAQALGKIPVNAPALGVDYLTIVGHKFNAPRIGALYVNSPGTKTPLYPLLFGGGQERNFRPGQKTHPMIAGLGKAADLVTSNLSEYESHMRRVRNYLEADSSHFPGSEILPNTCNVSILGPNLPGWKVLSWCERLLASVGAACHSDKGHRPSHILLNCGISEKVAANALRLSVGRDTTEDDVEVVVEDLRTAVSVLEEMG
ncbi:hypothetical protein WMY93_024176 [Mugilogobius chulae]|uniref:Selenocysteine lyase n=1 Tax=Mugilogobius chulae TaxID=88201 RepID=A0AAW0N5N9_9GOBI